jgi:hypothetical protein
MKLIRWMLVELIILTGGNRKGLMFRFACAAMRKLGYATGRIDRWLWDRYGFTYFEPPPHKRLLGRRD